LNKKRILIAITDDHLVVRAGVRGILSESESIELIQEYSSAAEMMRDLANVRWEVLILDIDLKDGTGIELTEQILSYRPDLKIIILSVYPAALYGVRALKAGALGYISKDFVASELTEAIIRVSQGSKYIGQDLANVLANQAIQLEPGQELHDSLSNREYQVLCLMAAGKSNISIAEHIKVSPKTISTYRMRIMKKMQMDTTADLLNYALAHKLKAIP